MKLNSHTFQARTPDFSCNVFLWSGEEEPRSVPGEVMCLLSELQFSGTNSEFI